MVQPATAVRVAGFALRKARTGLDGRADLVARARTELRLRVWAALLTATLTATVLVLLAANSANAVTVLPSGFQEEVALSGLTNPTNIEFSQDGRVFVAEKSGLIKVFDNVSDTTPTTFADLRTNVHNFWDRAAAARSARRAGTAQPAPVPLSHRGGRRGSGGSRARLSASRRRGSFRPRSRCARAGRRHRRLRRR